MNMNLLKVVTLPSIYRGCSAQKTLWQETFTPVNMKNYGRCNVKKHREIKNGEKYIALDVYLNSGSLENIKMTSS